MSAILRILVIALLLTSCDLNITTTPQPTPPEIPTPIAPQSPTASATATLAIDTPENTENAPTPLYTLSSTIQDTNTWIPSLVTETATSTTSPTVSPSLTPTLEPSPTPETFPIRVSNQAQLEACVAIESAVCVITGNVSITRTLSMQTAKVTLTCDGGRLTNTADNIRTVLEVRAGTVTGCLIYRTMNTVASCCADTVSIHMASGVVFRGNTVLWGVDGSLDISNCDDCLIEQNIIAESLNCATHLSGCHSFLSLVRDSRRVRFVHNVLASSKARLPQFQNCQDCAFLNNVIANYDGAGTQVTFCTELDYADNFGLRGQDTDAIAYLIVLSNIANLPPDACRPKVFLANNSVDFYRITRPFDEKQGVYVAAPLTAYYPLPAGDVWTAREIVDKSGAHGAETERVRACVLAGDCTIRDAPPG